MKIKLNVYKKKNGEYMIYANNDRGVSLGIGETFPSLYGKFKATQGQIKIADALSNYFKNAKAIEIKAPLKTHEELFFDNALGRVYLTDTATVCGISVKSDGAYLMRDEKLYDLSQWVAV